MTLRGIELVKKFEGFSPSVYLCPAGYPTIGYGHIVRPEEKFSTITEKEAEDLLIQDLLKFEMLIIKSLPVELPPLSLDAITSFVYNVGFYAFRASTLRKKLIRKEFLDAAGEFLRWVYAGGKKLKGLVLRRQAEQELFLEGIWK